MYSHEMEQQLNESLALLKELLGSDLLGVYLYGSACVGGLQKYSDIDLFVVINRATTAAEKKQLVTQLLSISGIYMQGPKRPIELTLVQKSHVNPWRYPPRIDFQYGEWLRALFERGVIEPSDTDAMADLALIVTQVLLKSKTLSGPPSEQLLARVPYRDVVRAMTDDMQRLTAELADDTRNVLLTLARIWSTLETDAIHTKPAAAQWAIQRLPEIYHPVMQRAHAIAAGAHNEQWDDIKVLIHPCVNFMVDQINACTVSIDYDDSSKKIKLAAE